MAATIDKDVAPLAALSLPKPSSSREEEDSTGLSTVEKDPDAIPELSTLPATDTDSRVEALKLVADSVAQQRNMGARTCIYHPATLAFLVAAFAGVRQYFYSGDIADYMLIGMVYIGVIMSVFVGIRFACGGYIDEAEQVGTWKWLNKGRSPTEEEETGVRVLGDKDEVLLTKFGEYFIGAIIFRGVQPVTTSASPSKRTRKSQSANPVTIQIRGWTVAQKYRRKGVGTSLIEDALKIGHEKGWTAGGVEFAEDHANSKRLLPAMFSGGFEKMDRIAKKTLEKKLEEFDSGQESKGRRKR